MSTAQIAHLFLVVTGPHFAGKGGHDPKKEAKSMPARPRMRLRPLVRPNTGFHAVRTGRAACCCCGFSRAGNLGFTALRRAGLTGGVLFIVRLTRSSRVPNGPQLRAEVSPLRSAVVPILVMGF